MSSTLIKMSTKCVIYSFLVVIVAMFLLVMDMYLSQDLAFVEKAPLPAKCNRSILISQKAVTPTSCNGSMFTVLNQLLMAIKKARILTLSKLDTGGTGRTERIRKRALSPMVTLLNANDGDSYWRKVSCIKDIETVVSECEVDCKLGLLRKDPFCVAIYNWGVTQEQCAVNHPFVPPNCKEHLGAPKSLELEDHVNVTKSKGSTIPSSFVHIIKSGIIDSNGYVQVGQNLIIPNGCTEVRKAQTKRPNQHYKEIFVISQLWGVAYFHANIENIPRLAMYITFLKEYDNIKVHVASKNRYTVDNLNVLGMDKDRLVTGLVHGDVVYVPQGGGCGEIHQPSGHLLSLYYHHYIENYILHYSKFGLAKSNGTNTTVQGHIHPNSPLITTADVNCTYSTSLIDQLNLLVSRRTDIKTGKEDKYFISSQCSQTQDATFIASHWSQEGFVQLKKHLILIKRIEKRWLVQHDELALILKNLSTENGLNFVVYSDEMLPSFNDTMLMFYNAALIVAPHGAGLSNMIYSKPGTYIVEVLCREEPNFCFKNLAQKQGMHYFGFSSINKCGPMKVDIDALITVVELFIKEIVRNTQIV